MEGSIFTTNRIRMTEARTPNIVLAIVGQTAKISTFVILCGISAKIGLTFFKCPTIVNT
jgi:hypothetical protein